MQSHALSWLLLSLRRLLLLAAGLALVLPACSLTNAVDEPVDPNDNGSSGTGGSNPGGSGGTSSGSGGNGGNGGNGGAGAQGCDSDPPTVISPTTPLTITPPTAQVMLTFSEEVTVEDGALSLSGGATMTITPTLPATATSFTLDMDGLTASGNHVLTIDGTIVVDDCTNLLGDDVTIELVGSCGGDTDPPVVTSTVDVSVPDSATTASYVLTFDEPTLLGANALSISDGATIASVTPPLPATAASFTIDLTGVSGSHELSITATEISDVCGNVPTQDVQVWFCYASGGSVTFNFTGAVQSFVVPACAKGTVAIQAYGAQGGLQGSAGGLGGLASGELAVATGDTLDVSVGGQGQDNQSCGATGGFNGGGATGVTCCSNSGGLAGSGGGASDVRAGGQALANRVIVAGAGGGSGSGDPGGVGGGLIGGNGGSYNGVTATGGTQSAGGLAGGYYTGHTCSPATAGALGLGGIGDGNDGGGAGGGYYGGGGGANNGGGAGGSSYIAGLTNGQTQSGQRSGNGQITISW